ncbi:MAG: UDP-N-acetylmuramoylalanyl-D-glutamyl-2,6-diaminopimelate--D-alanyl-D-alanine ligase [Alphaproteobacteria bacterium]|nr:UDP-N-acetylmuramoylalanyl-D-glutamyl-2,6-diaminopimelate--D-alanyl-D-alanine ligase [Alphaproteobacteria bacterium]
MSHDILWTSQDIKKIVHGHIESQWNITGISIDSRTTKPGDLFIALKGPTHDGHDFVSLALQNGACAALVEHNLNHINKDHLLVVDDTFKALHELGKAGRARSHATIFGVTGSVGKTSTKEALRHCLSVQAETYANMASYNNHWGVPYSLASMPISARYGIFEMGMNHSGEISVLTKLVLPHISIITTIEAVHLEFFKSKDDIASAKAEIFDGMNKDGIILLNKDNLYYDFLVQKAKFKNIQHIFSFGTKEHTDIRLLSYETSNNQNVVKADILGQILTYNLNMTGNHWIINSLAVLGAIKLANGDINLAAQTLASFESLKGRGQRIKILLTQGSFEIIDESYNASPIAMKAALGTLGKNKNSNHRLIAVLGDMLELGETGPQLHKDLLDPILDEKIDLVFACGPLMENLYQKLPLSLQGGYSKDSKNLIPDLIKNIQSDDIILIKGSLGSKMAPIVQALKELGKGL